MNQSKLKVITLANHKGHRQYSEPIKTQSNHSSQSQSTDNTVNQSKLKVITLANHKAHRQYSEPIKTQSNYSSQSQRTQIIQ